MEFTIIEGLRAVKFDLVFTLALAALFLLCGYRLHKRIDFLKRANIPAAVLGGLFFALITLLLRNQRVLALTLDTSLRAPLQTIFFTTIGLSATFALLRAGGWRMGFFWLLASLTAVVQNVTGILVASAMGAPLALGVICGALTLTGGPATGLAFTKNFQELGIAGAGEAIIASATFGILTASLVGNPLASFLIRRFHLAAPRSEDSKKDEAIEFARGATEEDKSGTGSIERVEAQALTGRVLLHNLLLILAVMGIGAIIGSWLARLGVTLPGYIGAMIVAAVLRNVDDARGWFKINSSAVEAIGAIALAVFLMIALMDLKLWQLAGLAVPMIVILLVQVVVMLIYATFVTFLLMGRDYEAAVMASGHVGFGLGITPNAVANMEALTERFRPAPRSFLVVPVVGAFFIDFSNALIITFFINLLR